jgi:EAL domain-containing protein (putative c-di-GMP-specific phosphodiesterase class I)
VVNVGGGGEGEPSEAQDEPGFVALVADDDPTSRVIAARLLRKLGAREVLEAADGATALSLVVARAGEIDVVISDLEMPEIDGVAFLRRLSELARAPAVVISSGHDASIRDSVGHMGRAYGLRILGAVDKPLTHATLSALLPRLAERVSPAAPVTSFGPIDVEACLQRRRFVPWYQPKVRFADGSAPAAEVLIRLEMEDGTALPPAAFMPQVIARGLIDEVTDQLLACVLDQLQAWGAGGFKPNVSVNLSRESLDEVDLGRRFARQVDAAGIARERITFEIVETELARDFRRAIEATSRLRILGFGLSVDDYGTGASTVDQLTLLPVTEMKIDQSLIIGAHTNRARRTVVSATVAMARELGITVVAEGIETPEDADFAIQAGCEWGQGYWLAHPMRADDVESFMRKAASA